MPKVFLYGTLKRGFRNHRRFEDILRNFLGDAVTAKKYVIAYDGVLPYLIPGNMAVKGQLFQVEEQHIRDLDRLELGSGYSKKLDMVRLIDRLDTCQAFLYVAEEGWRADRVKAGVAAGEFKVMDSFEEEDWKTKSDDTVFAGRG